MSQDRADSAEFQVHCLGNSADLGALKRSLEARGVVSRSRLTPAVDAVVVDSTVPADHPTLLAARELGIEILDPAQAFDRLLSVAARKARFGTSAPQASRTPTITLTVLVLAGMLAVLGVIGAVISSDSEPATVREVSEPALNPR